MNSHQKSIGNVFLVPCALSGLVALGLLGLSGCASRQGSSREDLSKEVSLKDDKAQIAELRKDIPDDIKKENDELGLILKMFGSMKDEPSSIREKWSRETRKLRDDFERTARQNREHRAADVKNKREKFLEVLKAEREEFAKGKHTSDERGRFFDQADHKRRDYFSEEREQSDRFESELRNRRQDFNDEMRKLQGQFDQEYRDYVKTFDEQRREKEKRKKEEEEARKLKRATTPHNTSQSTHLPNGLPGVVSTSGNGQSPVPEKVDPDLIEFRNRPSGPAIPVKSGENE